MIWKLLGCGALLAALILGDLLFRRWALLPLGRGSATLLFAQGPGGGLEQALRACLLLRRLGLTRHPIVLVDLGLDPEGRRLALRLARTAPDILVWGPPRDR